MVKAVRRVRASELKPGDLIVCTSGASFARVEFVEVHTQASLHDYSFAGAVIVRYSGNGASTAFGWTSFKPDDEVNLA